MKKKQSQKLKRFVSGLLSLTMITSLSAVLPANADAASKQEAYPYAVFAADELGGITLNVDGLTVNGNACTNGVYSTTAKYANINGTISENEALVVDEVVTDDESTTDAQDSSNPFDVSRDMIYIHNKLMTSWFNNGKNFDDDYTLSEMNINLNSPVYVTGKMSYKGNLALNTAIGAVSDVTLSDGNLNGNNAVIYSKFGDIKITESQASMNGLIYAPFGTVTIDCDNFNLNGLIIAQNVVIDSGNANINYSNTWAEFVGIETEKLSWTLDDWKYLADTDKDGLPNLIEKDIGTKPYDADTDGDLLPDGYEYLTLGTNPLKIDTDDNGVSDYDEDFDADGLSNGREYEAGTNPFNEDTDGDHLKDGDEVNTYFTNPLKVDTDDDGLNDDDEIYFGTDANDPDTDDNGILDGAEKRFQTFRHKVENEDCPITEVIVSMEGTGNLQKTTTVESVMNVDMVCTDVVGLVGEPFSIETTSKFDKATLSFKIDQSKLGVTDFDDLLFLWYDEGNYKFEELDTIYDEANSMVSIETTHFSKYMVVDKYLWFEAWSMQFNYNPGREHVEGDYAGYDKNYTVLTIDCSGSMSSNDPIGIRSSINSAYDAQFTRTCGRISASEKFISLMMGDDQTSIVLFDNYAFDTIAMTDDTLQLRLGLQKVCDRGGTEFLPAIKSSLDMFTEEQLNDTNANNRIILLSDGMDFYPSDTKSYLNNLYNQHNPDKRNRVKIYTIALGNYADEAFLEEIANITHGVAYKAYTASELVDIYSDIGIGGDFDTTDTDGDGLYDAVESAGIRLQNGKIITTNPTKDDTDYDGMEDGKEIDPTPIKSDKTIYNDDGSVNTVKGYYFVMKSDPRKKDTDGDGIIDPDDEYPCDVTDPLNPANIEYIKLISIPSAHSGQPDFIVSLVKSKMYDDEIFFAYAEGVTNTGGFLVSDELIKELNKLENGYNGHWLFTWASTEEAAAHAAKLETDQLVPTYFESGSSAYYGCWAYNMQAEIDLLNYYSKIVDQALQAYMVYLTLVSIYQSRMIAAQQEAMEISQQEYATIYRETVLGESGNLPQGITQEQFSKASNLIRSETSEIGGDVVVQGSRASGTAKATSDIDIAIRVDAEKFDELIEQRFKTPNPGSAKERTMLHAIETGKIQAGEAGLRPLRLELEEIFGMDVDISIIKIGGPFDNPPFIPFD